MDSDEFSDGEFDNGGRKVADDEFDDSGFDDKPRAESRIVTNQPFDEAVELTSDGSLDESVDTAVMASSMGRRPPQGEARGDSPPAAEASHDNPGYDSDVEIPGGGLQTGMPPHGGQLPAEPSGARGGAQAPSNIVGSMQDADGSESSSDDEGEDSGMPVGTTGGYNPADYAHLAVPDEVRELFQYIGRYKPHNIALDTTIKCFIPDYIPAVGEIDAFIKVDRPDGKEEGLGLKRLDEPSPDQSDPTVLDLQLRAVSKKSNLEPMMVRCIEQADKNPKLVAKWIQSVQDLHRTKPLPQVHYAKSMPDIEKLMQVWPEDLEELLKTTKLPSASMDLTLEEYARVICSVLDIPVYSSLAQSLHVLFTLYSEFKSNSHFMQLGAGGPSPEPGAAIPAAAGAGGNLMTFGESESKMP